MTQNKKGEDVDLGEYSDSYADDYNFGEDFIDYYQRVSVYYNRMKTKTRDNLTTISR